MRFEVIGSIGNRRIIAAGPGLRASKALARKYGPAKWRKAAGDAWIRLADGSMRFAELHWYEAKGIGRRNLKFKRFLDW
jgi:hypothetical protein